MKRLPLLQLLYQRYPDIPREELFAKVLCGEVRVGDGIITDHKELIPADSPLELIDGGFVSRGGEKLDAALQAFGLDISGMVFVDAGASTGGFTDCLLSRGARLVHAVDVGYNQLHYRLREDPRVLVHEKTNLMELRRLEPQPHAAVADLSFRSLRRAAAKLLSLTSEGWGLVLFKPQFEQGYSGTFTSGKALWRESRSPFSGLVSDDHQREEIFSLLERDLKEEGVMVEARVDSPVHGKKKGNQESILKIYRMEE
jgi:23S rRNA (cytidine1920-2'-O)/16S rRNA (cytidine1409-2'-O)-methyltransferase